MGLRDWNSTAYIPILALNGAEMQALEELPSQDKDALLPVIQLKNWFTAATLEKSLGRVEKAYGSRPYIADVCPAGLDEDHGRPVFQQLAALRASSNGYENWCAFIEEHNNLIPAIQLMDPKEIPSQTERFAALGRGMAVHVTKRMIAAAEGIAQIVGSATDGGSDLCFVLDLGRQNEDLLGNVAVTVKTIERVRGHLPKATLCVSASSFPSSFVGVKDQAIFERTHFDNVKKASGEAGLIYSDRGSARAEKQLGGGGSPSPRIDYAGGSKWDFFRSDTVTRAERPAAYIAQAKKAVKADCWDKDLHVWGCQMIEKTSKKAVDGIKSQQSAAAARINIHLHRQLWHGNPAGLYDTDEDWSD
ncbi:hypothetical protein [Brevundimonas sp.]|uniref:beta family protein n=1 Tax=Brevundimonas sp. TaxID=1871086 RepID=UPI0037BFF4F6